MTNLQLNYLVKAEISFIKVNISYLLSYKTHKGDKIQRSID